MNIPGNLVADWLPPLLELTEKLRDVTNLGHCLVHVADAAKVLIPCDGASLRLFDETREQFFAIARAGKNVHTPLTITLSANMGLLGWVGREAVSAMVNDTREDPRFEINPHQVRDVRSIICAPLIVERNVLGVLGVTHTEPDAFTEEHHRLVQLLANTAAPSIERAQLRQLSTTDPLTRVYNRIYLGLRLNEEIQRASRHGHPLSVVMFGIDRFNRLNQAHSVGVGNKLLRLFAERLRCELRIHDVVCRYEDERFCVVMPETSQEAADAAAARILERLGAQAFQLGEGHTISLRIQASAGSAAWKPDAGVQDLMDRAAAALSTRQEAHQEPPPAA